VTGLNGDRAWRQTDNRNTQSNPERIIGAAILNDLT
jgi:hypothetical protein